MFKLKIAIFLFYFYTVNIFAFTIKGKVISQKDSLPVEFANVFIANTTFGTITDLKGKFSLKVKIDGAFNLVVAHISYESYSMDVQLNYDIDSLTIAIKEKAYPLQNIDIAGDISLWESNYRYFKSIFLGNSANTEYCTIVNPKSLRFRSIKEKGLLTANTDTFLIVRNDALGYVIKYKIESFVRSPNESYYYGYVSFEDISDSLKRKRKQTLKNRIEAYKGSSQHFLKGLYFNSFQKDGFKALNVNDLSDIYKKNYIDFSMFVRDTVKGWKILEYSKPFRIYYYNSDVKIFATSKPRTTLVILRKGKILFDKYGLPSFPVNLMMDGYMSNKRVADMVPLEFNLEKTQKELEDL